MERTAPSSSPPQALTQPSSQELPHKSTDSNSDTGNHNMEDVMCSPQGGNNEQVKENKMQGLLPGQTGKANHLDYQPNSSLFNLIHAPLVSGFPCFPVPASNATTMVELLLVSGFPRFFDDSFKTSSGVFPFVKQPSGEWNFRQWQSNGGCSNLTYTLQPKESYHHHQLIRGTKLASFSVPQKSGDREDKRGYKQRTGDRYGNRRSGDRSRRWCWSCWRTSGSELLSRVDGGKHGDI
nr:probable inactive receptor kinase At5g67200 [Ipomoea batatas]